jgi:hypothetical protein
MKASEKKKLPYRPPQLDEYGTIAQLTHSGMGDNADNTGKDKIKSAAHLT